MVGKADPAVIGDGQDLGLRTGLGLDRKIGHVAPVDLGQFAIGHGDGAFVQDEEVLGINRLAVPREDAVGRQAARAAGRVLDRLRDGEEIILVDRDLTLEGQARRAIPGQRHRRPAVERVIGLRPAHGIEQVHDL